MSRIRTGWPAFPTPDSLTRDEHNGMSLRDYFAGQALVGMLANEAALRRADIDAHANGREFAEETATIAYEMADAMVAAREQEPQS